MGKYYITTTLPYVNAKPHIGFALEIVRADAQARLHRTLGEEVFFNTGTDEHGQKIYQEAVAAGKTPKEYCDEYAAKFDLLKSTLNLTYNSFVRTTDEFHLKAAGEFWKKCAENGDIYKAKYNTKYCVGCELAKTDSELVDGKCPFHSTQELESREEENYFFRFSKYEKKLLELYEGEDFVVPAFRKEEIGAFVKKGLQDFSISRIKEKMAWGIKVPGDPTQVMYVWFDALINYISVIGWPSDMAKFESWWPGYQIAGKDNLRQQTAMWQAMLMSAGLPNSKQVFIEGFITAGGQKMSKSLGNVIDPIEYVERYGTEALRYYLLAKISSTEDSDMTGEIFEKAYQADLANGLGNLVARVGAMCKDLEFKIEDLGFIRKEIVECMGKWEFDKAMGLIWEEIKKADLLINQKEVWKLAGEKKTKVLTELVGMIRQIGVDLGPFMPETSAKILNCFGEKITKEILFRRLD